MREPDGDDARRRPHNERRPPGLHENLDGRQHDQQDAGDVRSVLLHLDRVAEQGRRARKRDGRDARSDRADKSPRQRYKRDERHERCDEWHGAQCPFAISEEVDGSPLGPQPQDWRRLATAQWFRKPTVRAVQDVK